MGTDRQICTGLTENIGDTHGMPGLIGIQAVSYTHKYPVIAVAGIIGSRIESGYRFRIHVYGTVCIRRDGVAAETVYDRPMVKKDAVSAVVADGAVIDGNLTILIVGGQNYPCRHIGVAEGSSTPVLHSYPGEMICSRVAVVKI